MSAAKPDDLQPRDKMLSRLLAESRVPVAGDANCPDAEMLAAYADRNLAPEEVTQLEIHLADCTRCQQILVALAVSAEESPVLETAPVRKTATSPVSIDRAIPRPAQPTRWRQLAPAIGIAAAVALWFALQPRPIQAPAAQLSAAKELSAPPPAAPSAAQSAASSEAQDNSEIAENFAPAPPPPPAQAAAPRIEIKPGLVSPRQSQTLSADASQSAELKAEPAPAAVESNAPASGASAGKAQQSLQAEQNPAPAAGGSRSADTLSARAQTAAPTFAPAAPAPGGDTARPVGSVGGISALAARPRALAKVAAPLTIFASPNHSVLWRIGAGGSIERSTDQGATWQPQASGVTSELLAGAAVSNDVAWIVGRAGVILRTTDGARWQRVQFPLGTAGIAPSASSQSGTASAPPLDFTAIEARDALHATVTAANGRRFATSDGGQTWSQQ